MPAGELVLEMRADRGREVELRVCSYRAGARATRPVETIVELRECDLPRKQIRLQDESSTRRIISAAN